MKIPIPTGTFDVLPFDQKDPWKHSHIWSSLETQARAVAGNFGFSEIRTPIFERTELFIKGTGSDTDIVSKEMYTFQDKGDRSMTLRPEGTPPVMRAVIEKGLTGLSTIQKLFYIGPMFRYERPQAGRYRQHHQFGAEVIGVAAPEQDAELIDMMYNFYSSIGIKNVKIIINSIGESECRQKFRQALIDYLEPHLPKLSEDSQRRFKTNPLRILDSKDSQDQHVLENAPSILEFLNPKSKEHFERVKQRLTDVFIPFEVRPKLVRGLDYYTDTVFEVVSEDLGAQNSMGGGGRYDGLLKKLGGPDLPTVGFATGLERILQTLYKQGITLENTNLPYLFMIPLGDGAKEECFKILHKLRQRGVQAEMDYTGKKLGKVMSYANLIKAENVAVIGDEELKSGSIEVKNMESGQKQKVSLDKFISRIEQQFRATRTVASLDKGAMMEKMLTGGAHGEEKRGGIFTFFNDLDKSLGEMTSEPEEPPKDKQ